MLVIWILGCSCLACGGGSESPSTPTPVTPANVTGFWRGTLRSEVAAGGFASISANLSQAGNTVSGTLSCSPGNVGCLHSGGTIRGIATGSTITAQLQFPDGHSCDTFNGTISDDSMSGSYSCLDPLGNDRGSWSVTRGPTVGTQLVRETMAGTISVASPVCSSAFQRSVDASYYRGGTQRCAEFERFSHTAGIITATLMWQDRRIDLDLVLNDGVGMNFRQSIAANRSPERLEFFINAGTAYLFVVYLRGVAPQFLANGGRFTGDVSTAFTLTVERPE